MESLWVMLCVALVTPRAMGGDDDIELWLEDYTGAKDSKGHMQSDSPHGKDQEEEFAALECPKVPDTDYNTLSCLVPKCDLDTDCLWPKEKCCNNGCLFSCTKAIPPPPFIDWRREPQRDPITGISWLIKDEDGKEASKSSAQTHINECLMDGVKYTDGQQFTHHHHTCKCHKGLVDCFVNTVT